MSKFTLREWIQQIETEIAAARVNNHLFREEIANGTVNGISVVMIERGRQKLEWLKELQRYKDLEDAGRLTEQPCKPGDKVWVIEDDDYAGYLFMGMCGDYAILCSKYTSCEDFNSQLERMAEETVENYDTHVSIFHKNDIYLTKEDVILELTEREECDYD